MPWVLSPLNWRYRQSWALLRGGAPLASESCVAARWGGEGSRMRACERGGSPERPQQLRLALSCRGHGEGVGWNASDSQLGNKAGLPSGWGHRSGVTVGHEWRFGLCFQDTSQ